MKAIFGILLISFLLSHGVYAQVGVNTPTPSSYSVLELKDSERGFLPPRLTRLQRTNMINSAGSLGPIPAGLIVYDTDDQMFYYYNPSNGDTNSSQGDQNWQALSPMMYKDLQDDFQSPNFMRTVETHRSVKNVHLFASTVTSVTRRLHVKGGVSISETNTAPPADYGLYAQGNSAFGGNVAVTGSLSANSLSGLGVVPVGAIVLWSGSAGTVPTGWAICNGSNGTPDLRDKFVLGNGGSESQSGGNKTVTLTTANLPAHTHTINITATTTSNGSHTHNTGAPDHFRNDSGGADEWAGGDGVAHRASIDAAGAHTHSVTIAGVTGSVGTGSAVNIMPPYYSLYYIMRIN